MGNTWRYTLVLSELVLIPRREEQFRAQRVNAQPQAERYRLAENSQMNRFHRLARAAAILLGFMAGSACQPVVRTELPEPLLCQQESEFSGQLLITAERTVQQSTLGLFQGRVIHNNKPVQGAVVGLTQMYDGRDPYSVHTLSSKDGSFRLTTAHDGKFLIHVFHEQFHHVSQLGLELGPAKHVSAIVCMKIHTDTWQVEVQSRSP